MDDGVRTLRVRAVDSGGNPSTGWHQILIDNALPDTTIGRAPGAISASRVATFAFASEPGATFACALDRTSFAPCGSPVRYEHLGPGRHTFRVRARDAAGNLEPTPASWTWTVDLTRPDTSVVGSRTTRGLPGQATFQFRSRDRAAAFRCSLDGAPWTACLSPIVYEAIAVGAHRFRVRAVDPAGNVDWTPVSHVWSVRRVATGVVAIGSERADVLVGTSGADELHGLGGNDIVRGLGGADRLDGAAGRDRLLGGARNDVLIGGPGMDVLEGGPGSDLLDARDGGRDTLHGGSGRDRGLADLRLDRLRAIELRR